MKLEQSDILRTSSMSSSSSDIVDTVTLENLPIVFVFLVT